MMFCHQCEASVLMTVVTTSFAVVLQIKWGSVSRNSEEYFVTVKGQQKIPAWFI